jgi:glycosidase
MNTGKTVHHPRYPSLYQINTRVRLTELARPLGRPATLDDFPDSELDEWVRLGFDWIWLLSVWQTGPTAQTISRSNPEWRREFAETLPNLSEEDIPGSGFAIASYAVHSRLGGDVALARLRERLSQRGLRLMLDFVPNHMSPDHPWVQLHPDYFVHGTEADLETAPHNYCRVMLPGGPAVLAFGRDPYFAGWPDTVQLNYGNPAMQAAMIAELERISGQCDGVRCDMAMLILPEVFRRTWAIHPEPFWPNAIASVRRRHPGFLFMAEVYWDLEWEMQQQGFDYAYDKRLYDRLREGHPQAVREHLSAGLDFQDRLARFLENHDEPRAASTFPPGVHEAAAVVTFMAPGLRFFHQGQLDGRLKRISPHLGRGPEEQSNPSLMQFYERLLAVLRLDPVREGQWQLLECVRTWEANTSADRFIAYGWLGSAGERLLVVVNYAPHASQCFLRLPFSELGGRRWVLQDLLGGERYERDGADLLSRGLFLDVPPWHCHIFTLTQVP